MTSNAVRKTKTVMHLQIGQRRALCGQRRVPSMTTKYAATTCAQCLQRLPPFQQLKRSAHRVSFVVRGYQLTIVGDTVTVQELDRVVLVGVWRRGGYVAWPRGTSSAVPILCLDDFDAALRVILPEGSGVVPPVSGAFQPGLFDS